MMNPMDLLDMERRSGVSNQDLDDFVRKADAVARAVDQIKNGTFDPDECDVPGYLTPEQEAAEERARQKREAERRQREEERKRKEKADEHESWWTRAKLRFSIERAEDDGDDDDDAANAKADAWANRVVQAYKARDANDYSVWNAWEPKDPVTMEEKARQAALDEKMKNDAFERANPDFCTQFQEDIAKRQKSTREKAKLAEKLKMRGNAHYKRKQYADAITQYMAALAEAPHDAAILTNVAQTYLRLECLDDALEFCTRALYVAPTHMKALSRKAAVLHRLQDLPGAAAVMKEATRLHPDNKDLLEQHSAIVGEYDDVCARSALDASMAAPPTLDTLHLHAAKELLAKLDDDSSALAALSPVLQVDAQVRLLFRTSGALASVAAAAETNATALDCLVAATATDDRNKRALYHDAAFRAWFTAALASSSTPALWQLLEALVAVPFWKNLVVQTPSLLAQLLRLLAPRSDVAATAASLLFTVSDLHACRVTLTTSLVQPVLRQSVAFLRAPAPEALSDVLGTLLNLSNESVFREIVETEPDVHLEMTQCLVDTLAASASERAAAVLLNLAINPTSAIRNDLHVAGAPRVLFALLERDGERTLQSHCVSLLCRLHSLPALRHELAQPTDLALLWRVLETSMAAVAPDAMTWHVRAQVLCHFAWVMELPSTRAFCRRAHCLTALFRSGLLTHTAPFPPAFERCLANATKCAIALVRDGQRDDVDAIVQNGGLEALVECMRSAKDDKVARKNVAILLASLCGQDEAIKARVRELRGIEMMLDICRSMKL
ncbi:hypothetical protein SPRG_03954 [Saprolegnia parasitica CBS 223.65]|uniref:Uncharacterized protein n=1 Tax=Saprolegnia parasitica (strain CBS 223.65) TaxID=695850 RepID=A0A067CX07_SAPPC|nr:hypothetical protein SPRG_03954 [Saprolegnia parasitica CBS 223.65]KDO31337.1 hypothetical protein SPRG_03954 [Saprolegnia parasitica CBS 223.65]|eukprot:XP_012197936.1 hypothetical protein SPRG_03954 [Saprolegnia parasitica CBS 223.65]